MKTIADEMSNQTLNIKSNVLLASTLLIFLQQKNTSYITHGGQT